MYRYRKWCDLLFAEQSNVLLIALKRPNDLSPLVMPISPLSMAEGKGEWNI